MALVIRAERKRRRCVALERLNFGMGVSVVKRTLVRDYRITRKSANLDINWASAQIVNNLDKYEYKDLMAWLITQTERVYLKALESNQLSAEIGSLNLMHRITVEAAKKKQTNVIKEIVSFRISHRSWTWLFKLFDEILIIFKKPGLNLRC
tara:strand:- start:329 stop:781 length:453 start_codon:yes stop_codon:yes gene_type:complete